MSRWNDPHTKNEREWDSFGYTVHDLKKEISSFVYSPIRPIKNKNYDLDKPPYSNPEEFSINSHIFILPKDYVIWSLEEILQPLPVPQLPDVPKLPDLQPLSSPTWYDHDIESKSFFKESDLAWSAIAATVISPDRYSRKLINWKERALIDNLLKIEESKIVKNSIESLKLKLTSEYDSYKISLTDLAEGLHDISSVDQAKLLSIAHESHYLPSFLRTEYEVVISKENKIALIEFEFPDYSNIAISTGFKNTKRHLRFLTASQKKKAIKQCLYSLIIRFAYLASKFRINNSYDAVVVNVEQKWFDPATGQPRQGIIASLQAPVEYLQTLDLSKLDPEACFKFLKGLSTPSLDSISPIRPIFVLNKDDERLVESKDVDSRIDEESNLAAMEWEDFEHLVAQLFEWEFSKNGIEVKVTRASRDRGVDAILFDPDPLKGGKYVIQAKRYTRTVDVSAVRDLYGTVMNEGANRGILITTASYGPDAYEFAKDKPLSLVDGQNLLVMLQKHGKKFKIDLEEARRLNNES
jgi:HJR/Mrr/RecB family endonuclease